MKLYMKQKVFSWVDRFSVKDADGCDKYLVEGEFFSWGKKLHVNDMEGREVAFIQQKLLTFLPRFHVYIDGAPVAEIVKELTLFRPKYSIAGLNWTIEGDFWAHDYTIVQGGECVVSIHKQWMTWGDCYELDVADSADERLALAVTLAIDCVTAAVAVVANS